MATNESVAAKHHIFVSDMNAEHQADSTSTGSGEVQALHHALVKDVKLGPVGSTRQENGVESNAYHYHLMVTKLLETPREPFDGKNHDKFHYWFQGLQRNLTNINASPEDELNVFMHHSTGEVREFIELNAYSNPDPEAALVFIKKQLKLRYGSTRNRAQRMYLKLLKFPKIKGNLRSVKLLQQLQRFNDLAAATRPYVETTRHLPALNTFYGLREIRRKLPPRLEKEWIDCHTPASDDEDPRFSEFCDFIARHTEVMRIEMGYLSTPPMPIITKICP